MDLFQPRRGPFSVKTLDNVNRGYAHNGPFNDLFDIPEPNICGTILKFYKEFNRIIAFGHAEEPLNICEIVTTSFD